MSDEDDEPEVLDEDARFDQRSTRWSRVQCEPAKA